MMPRRIYGPGTNFVSCLPSDYKGIEIPCYFIHNGLRLLVTVLFVIDANFDEIYQGEAYFEVTKGVGVPFLLYR